MIVVVVISHLIGQQAHRLRDRDADVVSSYQPNTSRWIIIILHLDYYAKRSRDNSYLVRFYRLILLVVVRQISYCPSATVMHHHRFGVLSKRHGTSLNTKTAPQFDAVEPCAIAIVGMFLSEIYETGIIYCAINIAFQC
jgi:hypothetical protein